MKESRKALQSLDEGKCVESSTTADIKKAGIAAKALANAKEDSCRSGSVRSPVWKHPQASFESKETIRVLNAFIWASNGLHILHKSKETKFSDA